MTVAEYIEKLKALPQDAEVFAWDRTGSLATPPAPEHHSVWLADGYVNLIYEGDKVEPHRVVVDAVIL